MAIQPQSGAFTVKPLEICGNGVIEAGEACDDGNTDGGDGCSATCQTEPLDHFLCYKIKESKGNICTADAPQHAGGGCDTEEDCGGVSSGASATRFCIRNKFPKGIHATLADEFEHKSFEVTKPVGLCNPANKNDEGITDPDTHLKAYQIRQLRKSCTNDAPQNPFGACKKEKDCGGVQGQTSYCQRTARFKLITDIFKPVTVVRVDNQFGTIVLDVTKSDRLLVPTAKDLDKPTDAPDPGVHNLDHFKCYTAKISRGQPKFPRDLQAYVVDQFNQPKRYAIKKPKHLCVPVDKNDEGIKNVGDALTCYPVKQVRKACAAGAPQNPLEACRREQDCGGVRRQTKYCQTQPKHSKVLNIHLNNQFGPERLDTKGEDELCVPSQIQLQP